MGLDQRTVEESVLAQLDSLDSLSIVRASGITEDSFDVYPHVYRFVHDYVREYGSGVPSSKLLLDTFGIALPEKGDSEFFIDELKKREIDKKTRIVLERGIDLLNNGEGTPNNAIAFLLVELAGLRRQKRLTRSLTDKEASSRLDRYLDRARAAKSGLTIGLKAGLSFLDEDQAGLFRGNLVGIIGNTTVGKSWLLEYISVVSYVESNSRVLFISPEMSIDQIERRWDTLVGRHLGMEFSNMGLMRGLGIDIKKYKTFLERVKTRSDWMTCEASDLGKSFTLSAIEDLTTQFKPTLVAVDGLPLLGSEVNSKASQWERLADIAYGLKNFAKSHDVLVIVTNQATRDAEGKEDPKLKDSGYSYAFVQACDQVIMISSPNDDQESTKLVRLLKVREGKTSKKLIKLIWDVDRGVIEESVSKTARQ